MKGGKGVNVNRASSMVRSYHPPMIAPRRVIGLEDIETRQFGETPVYSKMTPADRALRMQAEDLNDLLFLKANRRNKQAADILTTGRTIIKGYADDGRTVTEDEVIFESNPIVTPTTLWTNASAKIYDDLKTASETIQEATGQIPTLMICGKNVEGYLLNNTQMKNWLSIPNRETLNMMSFAPHYTTPQARFLGYVSALNLEVVSYMETYIDDDGQAKPFLDADTVIIGNPDRGRQIFGAVTYLDMTGNWQSLAAEDVPVYSFDTNAQQTALTLYSRFLLVPYDMEDWVTLKVK